MDMRDRELDAWISAALQPGTSLSTRGKHRAWEQVSSQVTRQRMLAPIELEPEPMSFLRRVFSTSRLFYSWMANFATEEAQYERARQSYAMMRYGGPSREGRLILQIVNPISFTLMSPAI